MIRPRRRATVPAPATPKSINTPHSFANRPTPPSRSQSAYLPASERRPLKKLRKYYLSNLSSKDGSLATQDQIIRAATYYQSEGTYFIRLSTSGSQGNKPGVLLLESPRPRKGHNVPRLLRTISESSAVKTIGNMVPIAPNLGYFTIYRETPDSQINPLSPSITPETITLQTPLPLDNLIVLASKISSRRSRRSLDSPTRTWYIPAIWEGLKRLDTSRESTPLASSKAASDDGVPPAGVLELVDGVMRTFGDSLLLFHHKVLKIQRKSDRSMSASQERKNIVRQEIAERNQDIDQTQANWHAVEQEKEDLRRKESLLRKKLSARNQDAH